MLEKRNHKRAAVNMKVYYRDDDHTDEIALLLDISRGGMYIQTGHTPEVKENLEASIDAVDLGKVIWVEGRVVRKTSTGMGVMFTKTDEKGLDNLLISRSAMF